MGRKRQSKGAAANQVFMDHDCRKASKAGWGTGATPKGQFACSHGMVFNNATFNNIEGNLNVGSVIGPESDAEIVKIAEWFSPMNFRKIQNDTFKLHTPGTGRWLIESDTFKDWFYADDRAFWMTGMPGAGKTILTSIVTDHVQKLCRKMTSVVALAIYCRYHDRLSERDILASLARQLVESGSPQLDYSAVHSFYHTNIRQNTKPTATSLLDLLEHLFTGFQKVIISIDALDEIVDIVKEQILADFRRLKTSYFITSRPMDSFQELLPNTRAMRLGPNLLQNNDIEFFISTKIDSIPRLRDMCKGKDALRTKICMKLKAKSDGMFLLCALQMESLRQVTTVRKLWEAIESLPSGIGAMFRTTWQRIISQAESEVDLARRAITFVTHAKESLRPCDLQRAMAVSIELRTFDPDDIPGIDVLLSVCCGLIAVDEANDVVRLVHYTVHDFFVKLGNELWPSPHAFIAATCATYLSVLGFPDLFLNEHDLQPCNRSALDPFVGYAYDNWGFHAQGYEGEGPLPAVVLNILSGWVQYPLQDDDFDIVGLEHVTARYGLARFLPLILASKDKRTKLGWLPLHIAAKYGHEAIVTALLDHSGTDVNTPTSDNCGNIGGYNPLTLAAIENHLKIVEVLLSHADLNINWADSDGNTALILAARSGSLEIVQLLLTHPKIDVNVKNTFGSTALTRAATYGHLKIVELLITLPDVDVHWGSSLIDAAKYGQVEIVKFFLSHPEIDINMQDRSGATALTCAAWSGNVEIVKLLLGHADIDVDVKERSGNTALGCAAAGGHFEIVQLLQARSPGLETDWEAALVEAALHGQVEGVVYILSQDGCTVNARNDGETALTSAAYQGNKEIAQLLLACPDVDINLANANGATPLMLAASRGHLDVVRCLLSHSKILMNLRDNRGETAMTRAKELGHRKVLQLISRHHKLRKEGQ